MWSWYILEINPDSKSGKKYVKAVFCYPAYLTSMQRQSTSCEMLGWMNNKIKIAGRNINNLRYADDTTLMAESKEQLKSLLMRVKEESEKAALKLKKPKIMALSPITSWQIDGEQVETVTDFIFLGSRITVDSDCSYEIKTLVPWKKIYNKPRQHIEKQRHHFEDKGPDSQSYSFVWVGP